MGTVVCTVPCSRQRQGVGMPPAAAAAPPGSPAAASPPQLVVVIGSFHGSSASPTASVATQTPGGVSGTLRETPSRGLRHMTSSMKSTSRYIGSEFATPDPADAASSSPQQAVSPAQATPRTCILGRLLRRSRAASTQAGSTAPPPPTSSSPQHRKAHRSLRRRPDAQADEPHNIGKRPGATQYEQLFLGFSLVRLLLCSVPLLDAKMCLRCRFAHLQVKVALPSS